MKFEQIDFVPKAIKTILTSVYTYITKNAMNEIANEDEEAFVESDLSDSDEDGSIIIINLSYNY